jgi:hypothetical protein
MSFQVTQFTIFLLWGFGFFALIKFKNKWLRIGLAILMISLFAFNPFRGKQEGISKIEHHINRFDNIPPRVTAQVEDFQKSQEKEMANLKHESEEMKDEVHN